MSLTENVGKCPKCGEKITEQAGRKTPDDDLVCPGCKGSFSFAQVFLDPFRDALEKRFEDILGKSGAKVTKDRS